MENKITSEPASRSARCLFPDDLGSGPVPAQRPIKQEPRTPEKRASGFNVSDIIKKEQIDESVSSDDSGTDALHIAFDDTEDNTTSASCDTPQSDSIENIAKQASLSEAKIVPTSLISEYPPPSMTGYPYGFIPPHALYPMLSSGMYPSVYPGFMPYQPPILHHMMPQIPSVQQTTASPIPGAHSMQEYYNKVEDNMHSHRSPSPASSHASSGVYSDPSPVPSPTRSNPSVPSPEMSPVAPQRMRAPGGRTCYNQTQVRAMEKAFSECKYPDYEVFEEMSSKLNIPAKKIKVWFQNKRARSKSRTHTPSVLTPGYGYMAPSPMMTFPYPVPQASMMPMYPGYPYPSVFASPMC